MCRYAAAIARAVVEFLDAVLVGCFLSFFRLRSRPRDDSPGHGSGRRDSHARKVRLGELLLDDEKGFGGMGGSQEDLGEDCGIDEELISEANYLKLCGTISKTPAELQNITYQINVENCIEHDNIDTNALAMEATRAFEAKPSEGFRPELNTEDAEHLPPVDSVHQSTTGDKSPFQNIKSMSLGSSDSPFPTPLVIRDDMQTPGTVYTSHKGSSGKPARTRKQFVYPILRPIENNKLQQMELTEDSLQMIPSKLPKRRNLGSDFIKKPQQTSSDSVTKEESPDSLPLPVEEPKCQFSTDRQLDDGEITKSDSNENLEVCSLSHWLKHSPAGNKNQGQVEFPVGGQLYEENNLLDEGHVFMATEANWDVENPTPKLSKAWDCHGIPNTTTKYKEDQKVRWHATPFEERLLKVLSEEEGTCPWKAALSRGKSLKLKKEPFEEI